MNARAATVSNKQVLFVTNIPTPYRVPLMNLLYQELATQGISFRAVFGALGYPRRKWRVDMQDCQFPYEVLPTAKMPAFDPEDMIFTYRGLMKVLERQRPGVIVTNGFSVATTKLWARSLFRATPYIIWSGAVRRPGHPDSWSRRMHRKQLVSRATGFIAYGCQARDYLIELGASPVDIKIGINTVDTTFFARETGKLKNDNEVEASRKRFLFIGDLTPRKGLDRLLPAIQLLASRRRDFVLDVIGSGSEQANLEQSINELGIRDCVEFLGFKQKNEIPAYMARSFCFIFPTRHDIWGLVLVEAMAGGLASLSSVQAGATSDLIQNGQNGFAVDFSRTEDVVEKLDWLLDHPAECEAMGRSAQRFIEEQVTVKNSAAGFIAAIDAALKKDSDSR